MATGKAIVINAHGGPEVLERVPDFVWQPPGEGFVLVKVAGASINPVDVYVRSGARDAYKSKTFPRILGGDASGVVHAVGAGVSKARARGDVDVATLFRVGDRVYGLSPAYLPNDTVQGCYAEYALFREDWLAPAPATDKLPLPHAAAVPLVALTSWQALERAALQPGQKLLVTGASGGVGHTAVQLAKLLYPGVHVTGVCSAGKAAWVRSLGADNVYDYATSLETFADATGRNSFDAVLDVVGGELLEAIVKLLLKTGGVISEVRNRGTPYEAIAALESEYTVAWTLVQPSGEQLARIASFVDDGKFHIKVVQQVPLDEVQRVHDAAVEGHAGGKILLLVGDAGVR